MSGEAPPVAPDEPVGSLGRRLVLATVAFGVLFTVVAVGVRTWWAWEAHVSAMRTELGLIDQVFQRTLSKAIWEVDRDFLRAQVEGVAEVKPVGRIELKIRHAGRPAELIARTRPGVPASRLAPRLHRVLTYAPYPGQTEVVGELSLEGDERVLWDRLRGEIAGIVVTQVIQSLLLAGLVMWMFNRSVTVHVRRVARHLDRLTPATLHKPLKLFRSAALRDELSLLESGVNHLQGNLTSYLQRQREAERDLAAHRDRLADLVAEQTAELRAANARLEELSRSDPLTGLANRRHFDEVKEAEFRRAQRRGLPLSVLLCDVDHFKRYNDTYGHAAGDRCLQQVAGILKQTFNRAGELNARIGGEEFAVLLPAAELRHALAAAERLREALAEREIPHGGSLDGPHLTLSIGAAQWDPARMANFDALLHEADQALFRAKRQGRNQVVGA